MTDIPVSTGGAVAPGQVSFLNACLPPLTAGAYSLNWSQSVTGVGSTPPPPYTGDQPFIVSGPRFTLPGSTVQSVYPPAGKSGTFGDSLAHVVLSRATLPWERQPAPWLALLLVGNGDIPDGLDTTTVTELLTPAQGVVVPAIALDDLLPGEADSRCNSVELDAKLFAGLAPTADELPYLCHGREVAVDNKVEAAASADGRYAVVIGNRVVPAKLAVDTAFTALLVSLEGHMDHLPAYGGDGTTPVAPPQVANADRVRLCVLASWSFTASASAGSFSGLMKNLSRPGGIDMLQYPHDAQVGEPLAQKALDIGFVPLVHNTRSGEQTTSWYRGPLAPCPTNPAAVEPALFSDALLRYDPGTGLFDTSYALAWQIGRLLALADASFAKAMFDWRRGRLQQFDRHEDARARLSRLPASPMLARLTAPRHPDVSPALAAQAAVFDVAAQGLSDLPKVQRHCRRAEPLVQANLRPYGIRRAATDDEEDPLVTLIAGILSLGDRP